MTPHTVPLARILEIPIDLAFSCFVIFALLTWMLADHKVSQAMSTHCTAVSRGLTLQELGT